MKHIKTFEDFVSESNQDKGLLYTENVDIDIIIKRPNKPQIVKEVQFINDTKTYFWVSHESDPEKIKESIKKWCKTQKFDFNKIKSIKF